MAPASTAGIFADVISFKKPTPPETELITFPIKDADFNVKIDWSAKVFGTLKWSGTVYEAKVKIKDYFK